MTGLLPLFALLLASTEPVTAATAEAAARDAKNWQILVSQYPPRALAAGEQGAVGFKVSLDREGYATECQVTQSSGYPRLDEETCRLILNRATFKGVRSADGRKTNSTHEGVVNWRLPNAAPTQAPAARVAAAQSNLPEKKICKRKTKTGSLVDSERICLTKSEWARMSDQFRQEWGELQGTKGSTSGR